MCLLGTKKENNKKIKNASFFFGFEQSCNNSVIVLSAFLINPQFSLDIGYSWMKKGHVMNMFLCCYHNVCSHIRVLHTPFFRNQTENSVHSSHSKC